MARFRLPRLFRPRTPAERAADAARHAARSATQAVRRRLPAAWTAPKAKRAKPAAAKTPLPKAGAKPAKPPSRKALKAQEKARRSARAQARLSGVSFLGYVLVAGMILAEPLMQRLQASAVADPHDPQLADAVEPRRGRAAQHPYSIPTRGWRDIFNRVAKEFGHDRIMATAAGVTFYTLLAVFPAIGAFVSLYGLFSDVGQAEKQLHVLAAFVPPDILSFVGDEMIRIAAAKHQGLGLAFVIGLLLSIWSSNGAMKALFDGLNVAYEERESRGFVTLNLVSLTFTFGGLLFIMSAVGAIVAGPPLLKWLGLDWTSIWISELRWPGMMALLVFGLSLLYRYGPSRARARWVWLTPGSLFAAVMWVAASLLFSWYVSNFGTFNRVYGSLGAVIGFMTWLWYSTIIILVGAELNAEVEHQTAVDTTTGEPAPMGARGAHMADTLGAARGSLKEKVQEEKARLRPRGR